MRSGSLAATFVAVLAIGAGVGARVADINTSSPPAPKIAVTALGLEKCIVSPTNGAPGICAPKPPLTARPIFPQAAVAKNSFIDLSNNDPVFGVANFRKIKAAGWDGVIVKVNQAHFIDSHAAHMTAEARAAGLIVGGYDFADPTRGVGPVTEANIFIGRLKQLGLCRGPNTFPPTGDMEYGNITKSYVASWLAPVDRACGRHQFYTGAWYWNPHVGCFWPANSPGWVSAYASSVQPYKPCGIGSQLQEWQYSDKGFNGVIHSDVSTFLGSQSQWELLTSSGPPPIPNKYQVECKEKTALDKKRVRVHKKTGGWLAAHDARNRRAIQKDIRSHGYRCTSGGKAVKA